MDIRPGTGNGVNNTVAINDYFYVWNDVMYFTPAMMVRWGMNCGGPMITKPAPGWSKTSSPFLVQMEMAIPLLYVHLDDKLYFTAHENSNNGEQLWVT